MQQLPLFPAPPNPVFTYFFVKKEKAVKPLFLLFKVFFCVEARHIAELKEVPAVTVINVFLDILVVDLTCSDVAIEHRVGKAEVVLVGLAAEAVAGHLLHQHLG